MKELFTVVHPEVQKYPILINVPHAGEWIPQDVLDEMVASVEKCRRDLDLYVDQIWQDAPKHGVTLMSANVSRYVVDLNRADDDVSGETVEGERIKDKPGYYGTRGVVWRTTTDGTPVLPGPMSQEAFSRRIAKYHTPYHERLQRELDRIKEMFGYVVMIDAHSMPSQGRSDHPDSGNLRADVVPGNVHGATCADIISQTVESHYKENGYSVAMNDPYKGAWDTRHYGNPKIKQHAIQIEVNRKLYMDEKSFEIKKEGMKRLSEVCCELVGKLGEVLNDQGVMSPDR